MNEECILINDIQVYGVAFALSIVEFKLAVSSPIVWYPKNKILCNGGVGSKFIVEEGEKYV